MRQPVLSAFGVRRDSDETVRSFGTSKLLGRVGSLLTQVEAPGFSRETVSSAHESLGLGFLESVLDVQGPLLFLGSRGGLKGHLFWNHGLWHMLQV